MELLFFRENNYAKVFGNSYINVDVMIWTSSGPGCSKLMTSLVNVSLKFQTLISEICQYFLLKTCEAFALQKLLSFFQQKISVYLVIKS